MTLALLILFAIALVLSPLAIFLIDRPTPCDPPDAFSPRTPRRVAFAPEEATKP